MEKEVNFRATCELACRLGIPLWVGLLDDRGWELERGDDYMWWYERQPVLLERRGDHWVNANDIDFGEVPRWLRHLLGSFRLIGFTVSDRPLSSFDELLYRRGMFTFFKTILPGDSSYIQAGNLEMGG